MTNFRKAAEGILTFTNWGCNISREDFDRVFHRTGKSVRFTFNGWDGKSYDGESRNGGTFTCEVPGFEPYVFIKVGKGVHLVTNHMVLDKTTGLSHPEVRWILDVDRR